MIMKNIIYIAILILFTGCGNFLDEYSQDLVVPKTVSDLNEVLLGNGSSLLWVHDLANGSGEKLHGK